MKKALAILFLALLVCTALYASDNASFTKEEVKKFQLQNTFIGFGVGSRHQGDLQTAKKLMALDITGSALAVTGGLSLWASIFMYSGYRAMVGEVTKADIYISAGILASGVVMLIASKIIGLQSPSRY
ncbi:MAG: hypothetical protein II544_05805 [Spirochaetales bacterium]|nr:hypothetical protein [Spirochaetales bacterium]